MSWLGISTHNETTRIARGGWLDALRFIVAGLIIVHHYQLAAPVPLETFHPLFERSGYLLTNFFIIDSGYVLMRVYGARVAGGRMAPIDFFKKRFLRVVPAHVMVLSVLVAFVVLAGAAGFSPRNPEWFDWKQLPAQAFLVQAYGIPGGLGWNAPTWSVSALLGCYLLFPLLVGPMAKAGAMRALLVVAGIYTLANLATWTLVDLPVYQMPLKYGIWRVLPLFLLGMALARFSETVFVPPRVAAVAGIAAAVVLAILQLYGRFGIPSLMLTCVILLAAGAMPVLKPSKMVERVALMSFSMFISNEVVRIIYFGVVNAVEARIAVPMPVQWTLWAGGMVAALACAAAFHFLVDMPFQRRFNGMGGARRAEPRLQPQFAPG
jgi:peptidoglycan/LPS O-acetylase OafA/YrhL